MKLGNDAREFNKKECLSSFDKINSCDGNAPKNPLNFKFGGSCRGSYTYEIHPKKDRELVKHTDGRCEGWYKLFWEEYTIYGKNWAGWDYGQDTLLRNARKCVGGGMTGWTFDHFNKLKDHDGLEWKATFRTPLGSRSRCFNNLKVQAGSGGYTHQRRDEKKDEKYEDPGCGGNAW